METSNPLEGSLYATHTHAVKRLNKLIGEGREADAWAIFHEYEEWLDLHTDEDYDHDIYSLEYIGDDSEYD
tara:strand:- start:339 stop:551 length:213 start_codon:yes stop_codon:yes gene_type:complete